MTEPTDPSTLAVGKSSSVIDYQVNNSTTMSTVVTKDSSGLPLHPRAAQLVTEALIESKSGSTKVFSNGVSEQLSEHFSQADSFASLPLLDERTSVTSQIITHSRICRLQSENVSSESSNEMEDAESGLQSMPDCPAAAEESEKKKMSRSFFSRSSSIYTSPADIKKIKEYFKECITSDQRIQVQMYMRAYKEIIKFLYALGTILSFASRDIESKVSRMDELMSSDDASHYHYLDDLLKFELTSGLVKQDGTEKTKPHKGKRSGTRIMYRLHQAMAFLVQFFMNVREHPHAKMHTIVSDAYKSTISKNHSWLVRKTATFAFHAIPSRNTLIGRMGNDIGGETALMDELKEIIKIASEVYGLAATIFDKHSDVAKKEPKTATENVKHHHTKNLKSASGLI